ncbi:MAG TPA: BrnA antitoxin family protein [Verrucomicrobiae bacterium]|nr:BrnA antitoxin family protein [Verrucomicrobiae bacterium]
MKHESSLSRKRRAPAAGRRRKPLNLQGLREEKKRVFLPLHNMRISDLYKPLKKPVTLRLDADVIAWFKKDGRRYQTRINAALRKVMEQEIKRG